MCACVYHIFVCSDKLVIRRCRVFPTILESNIRLRADGVVGGPRAEHSRLLLKPVARDSRTRRIFDSRRRTWPSRMRGVRSVVKHDDCFHSAGPTTTAVPRPRRTPTRVARHRRPGNRPSAENSSPRSPFVRRLYSPLPPAVFEGPRIGDSFASRGRGLSVRTLERASFVNNAVSNVNPESAVPARTISHCGNRTCVQCIHGRCVRFGNRSSALTAP